MAAHRHIWLLASTVLFARGIEGHTGRPGDEIHHAVADFGEIFWRIYRIPEGFMGYLEDSWDIWK
jgi:hypothetical protein